ncbi:hypothetical protein [Micromonospora sp. WMMD980]|uniref:hypothetical protein n=1 Tax=Micromonospora sp. WMMD980 TaxID=3016088 RepID=UPI002416E82F|nr:hypothetical protein [Micromonospora sp. WMMD980]MDG4803057.1 hypothetical protein [Micromonospora sp. WMMD980]
MTTPSGGTSDDETWRRPEQTAAADGAPARHRPAADRTDGAGPAFAGTAGEAKPAPGGGRADAERPAGASPTVPEPAETNDPPGTDTGTTQGRPLDAASPRSRAGASESPWARPDPAAPGGGWTATGGEWPSPAGHTGRPAPDGYAGPPPNTPPPPGWRPPVHVQVPPPRRLPPQDMAAMDRSEQRAQQLTYGIGAVVGVVLLLLTCLLCSRILF